MTIRPIERAGYAMAAALGLSGLIHIGILVATGGTWTGPLSLRKPAVFGLSFGITLASLVWVSSFIRLGRGARTAGLSIFSVACVVETALVSMQAWRGVPSHFNTETPFDAAVAGSLAFGGFTLIAIIVLLTIASWRPGSVESAPLRTAIRVGLAALCGSMAVGGLMIARGMTLVAAGNRQAAYLTGGALKPSHAVMMHGVLVLPLFATLLERSGWSQPRQLAATRAACGLYLVVVALVVVWNLGV